MSREPPCTRPVWGGRKRPGGPSPVRLEFTQRSKEKVGKSDCPELRVLLPGPHPPALLPAARPWVQVAPERKGREGRGQNLIPMEPHFCDLSQAPHGWA